MPRNRLLLAAARLILSEADPGGRLPGDPDGPESEPWPEMDELRVALEAVWPEWREMTQT